MSWNVEASEYEVELDGRIVACFKPYAQLRPLETFGYGLKGTLLQLDDALFVRVIKVYSAEPKRPAFMQEGEPDWDDWDVEQELWRKTHPDNPIRLGRVVVERVEGISA